MCTGPQAIGTRMLAGCVNCGISNPVIAMQSGANGLQHSKLGLGARARRPSQGMDSIAQLVSQFTDGKGSFESVRQWDAFATAAVERGVAEAADLERLSEAYVSSKGMRRAHTESRVPIGRRRE